MISSPRRVNKRTGMFFLFLINVFWGLSFLFSKIALGEGLPPMTLAFLRYVITALVMVPLCLAKEKSLRLGRENFLLALASTLTGTTVYYFFEYTGLSYTTAASASLIVAAVPMLSFLYHVIFLHKPLELRRGLCVLGSLLGVFLIIVFSPAEGSGRSTLVGNLLILCAAICWVAYIEIGTKLRRRASSLRITAWQAVCALLTLAPFSLAEHTRWVSISPTAWFCVLVLGLICSALCYFLYAEALSVCDPVTVALATNINPLAACIAGVLFLHETLSVTQIMGGVIILACVVVESLRPQS